MYKKNAVSLLVSASIAVLSSAALGSEDEFLQPSEPEVRQDIRANKKKIKKLKAKLQKKNSKRLEKALKLAKEKHWALKERLQDGSLVELVGVDEFGQPVYYATDSLASAYTINTANVWVFGDDEVRLKLSGKGITIGEWDGGAVRTTHQEFNATSSSKPATAYEILPSSPRVIQKDSPSSISNHATHVAGTMISAGVRGDAQGMAPQATVHAYDWSQDETEMLNEAMNGLLLSNHSYGFITGWRSDANGNWTWRGNSRISSDEDYRFGWYSNYSADWDEIAESAPHYLIVKSAGNDRGDGPADVTGQPARDCEFDGFDCISGHGVSKNVLTVGAVEAIRPEYQQPSDVKAASFSSFGPADDGRIKPDLVANGVDVISTHGVTADDLYYRSSGTSMAAPSVTGSLALLQEHYSNVHDYHMLATTVKGLAIHTASEAGNHDGPDYQFGWGLMNTKEAALILKKAKRRQSTEKTNGALVAELSVALGDTLRVDLTPSKTDKPVTATIVWSDIPGTPDYAAPHDNRTPVLVNDLDMVIVETNASGETLHHPYTLDPLNPAAAATTGDNNVDNVEKIVIKQPNLDSTYELRIAFDPKQVDNNNLESLSLIASNVTSPDCFAPENIHVNESHTSKQAITVKWKEPMSSDGDVFISYREKGTDAWTELKAENNNGSHRLKGLQSASEYEIRARFECGASSNLYSSTVVEETQS